MTRRERMERRAALRREWAEKAEGESTRRWRASRLATEGIPFGQPVLVGHHSERHHRRALERSDSNMRAACEASDRAKHHEQKAAGIESQLERSIFSDDPDALEALAAKLAELEARRERMKLVNKLYKKGDAEGLRALGLGLEKLKAKLAEAGAYWGGAPHLPYELSNLGGEIGRARKRIEEIKHRREQEQKAEAAGGMLATFSSDGAWVQLRFSEKPPRETLDALREAGFRWGGGAWSGRTASLPEGVHDELCKRTREATR